MHSSWTDLSLVVQTSEDWLIMSLFFLWHCT
jgi:hypothetical protein